MNVNGFWDVVDKSRSVIDKNGEEGNMEAQVAELENVLRSLSEEEIIDFDKIFTKLMVEAYTWDLWGAAYIIGGGCSDDAFMDFRSWLISMGRETYMRALSDPESLVELADDPTIEDFFFEEFQYVPGEIVENMPDHELSHPKEPSGKKWDEESDDLETRFPRLWSKFGE